MAASKKEAAIAQIVSAAATEDQDQSDNDYPERVIVKKIAKTVIHDVSSILSL